MDAVKFLEEYRRMCNKYGDCVGCPMEGEPLCQCNDRKISHKESKRMAEIVENWSKENPEEVGKKYIIEIGEAKGDSHYRYRIKGTNIWLSEQGFAAIKKYNESEE